MPSATTFRRMEPRRAAALGFHVDVLEDRDRVQVRVVGELDLVTAPVLERHLQGALGRRPLLVVDLAAVTFLDVRGINTLVAANAEASGAGARMVVRGAGPQVRRMVSLCGLEGQLALED